jgi:hypothetical protein
MIRKIENFWDLTILLKTKRAESDKTQIAMHDWRSRKSRLKSFLNIEIASFMRTKSSLHSYLFNFCFSKLKSKIRAKRLSDHIIILNRHHDRYFSNRDFLSTVFQDVQNRKDRFEYDNKKHSQELSNTSICSVTHLSFAFVSNDKSKTITLIIKADERFLSTEYTNVAEVYRKLNTNRFKFTSFADAVENRNYLEYVFYFSNESSRVVNEC